MAFYLFFFLKLVIFEMISYGEPYVHVVDPNHDYAVCGPVQFQQSIVYAQPSQIGENEPNAYEVPVLSTKNKKKE